MTFAGYLFHHRMRMRSMSPSVGMPSAKTKAIMGQGEKKMNFKSDALTARAKKAGVLAEKARIERKIKDIIQKEKMLKKKAAATTSRSRAA